VGSGRGRQDLAGDGTITPETYGRAATLAVQSEVFVKAPKFADAVGRSAVGSRAVVSAAPRRRRRPQARRCASTTSRNGFAQRARG